MATTRLIIHHISKGETIAQSLADCFDYGQNPDKTQQGELISAYMCDPETADAEFLLSKAKYKAITGREQKKDADILCYQIRQAFVPGEISPEEANRIGYETAIRWTKGKYAFLLLHISTASIFIITFTTIPPPLTAQENSIIFGVPASHFGGSPTGYALKTGCPISPIPNRKVKGNTNIMDSGLATINR